MSKFSQLEGVAPSAVTVPLPPPLAERNKPFDAFTETIGAAFAPAEQPTSRANARTRLGNRSGPVSGEKRRYRFIGGKEVITGARPSRGGDRRLENHSLGVERHREGLGRTDGGGGGVEL